MSESLRAEFFEDCSGQTLTLDQFVTKRESFTKTDFSINEWIMKIIVSGIDDDGYMLVGKTIAGDIQPLDLFFSYAAAVLIFGLLLCIGVFVLLGIFVKLLCRLSRKSKVVHPTKGEMICEFIWLVLCFVLLVFGVSLFLSSARHLNEGTSNLLKVVDTSLSGVNHFLGNYGNSLGCILEAETSRLNVSLRANVGHVRDTLFNAMDAVFGEREMNQEYETMKTTRFQTVADVEDVSQAIELIADKFKGNPQVSAVLGSASIQSTRGSATGMIDSFYRIRREVDNEIDKLIGNGDKTLAKLYELQPEIREIVRKAEEIVSKAQETVRDFGKSSGLKTYSRYSVYLGLIPLVLPLLILVCGFIILMRFCANACTKRRGCISKLSGLIVASGGYVAMLSGAALFFLAALFFVAAFAATFLCMGLFQDDGFRALVMLPLSRRVYNYSFGEGSDLPPISIDIGWIGTWRPLTLREALFKCENEVDFFDALNGAELLAQQRIRAVMSRSQVDAYIKLVREIDVSAAINGNRMAAHSIEDNEALLSILQPFWLDPIPYPNGPNQKEPLTYNSFSMKMKDLAKSLDRQYHGLTKLTGHGARDRFVYDIKQSIVAIEHDLVQSMTELYKVTLDMSPQCGTLLQLYHYIGDYLCTQVSQPAQGLWIACVLCGIGSTMVMSTMFNATAYFYGDKKRPSDEDAVVDDDGDDDGDDDDKSEKNQRARSRPSTSAENVNRTNQENVKRRANVRVGEYANVPPQLEAEHKPLNPNDYQPLPFSPAATASFEPTGSIRNQ